MLRALQHRTKPGSTETRAGIMRTGGKECDMVTGQMEEGGFPRCRGRALEARNSCCGLGSRACSPFTPLASTFLAHRLAFSSSTQKASRDTKRKSISATEKLKCPRRTSMHADLRAPLQTQGRFLVLATSNADPYQQMSPKLGPGFAAPFRPRHTPPAWHCSDALYNSMHGRSAEAHTLTVDTLWKLWKFVSQLRQSLEFTDASACVWTGV